MPIDRRRFMAWGTVACGGFITAALGAPLAGYLLSPLWAGPEPAVERLVGDVSGVGEGVPTRFVVEFPENSWLAAVQQPHTVYVIRQGATLKALANVCTHMQCDVHWDAGLRMFLCPCHGGLYAASGRNIGGPPPKPLPEYRHRLEGDLLYVTNRFNEQI
jgi:Rieske Fe-S protein